MANYVPVNSQIYIQAFVGAQVGMSASGRWNTDPAAVPSGTDDVNVNAASVAAAWAREFDTLFAASGLPVDCYSTEATKMLSAGVTWERNPVQGNPPQAGAVNQADYSVQVLGILAMIAAGESNFAAQAISIPACCCGST